MITLKLEELSLKDHVIHSTRINVPVELLISPHFMILDPPGKHQTLVRIICRVQILLQVVAPDEKLPVREPLNVPRGFLDGSPFGPDEHEPSIAIVGVGSCVQFVGLPPVPDQIVVALLFDGPQVRVVACHGVLTILAVLFAAHGQELVVVVTFDLDATRRYGSVGCCGHGRQQGY